MSNIISPTVLDATFANRMDKLNALLAIKAEEHVVEEINWKEIGGLVRKGLAADIFSIGDQLVTTWKDIATNTTYNVPLDIVSFDNVTLENGDIVPGMILQWHYCTPFGVQFDQNEAFYCATEGLAAGTYCIKMGNSWGSNVIANKIYNFTLTQDVPVNGQLQFGTTTSEIGALPDTLVTNWRVRVYTSATTLTPTEILPLTEGEAGVSLGTLSSSTIATNSGINNMQRASFGYNRWSQSGVRQFLNSSKAVGSWWSPKNIFDRPCAEVSSKHGFLTGFSEEFLSQLKPVKITTALNTLTDKPSIGADIEYTYDTFFLPSKANENLNAQYIEDKTWEYWYRATNGKKPADYTTGAAPITYSVANHTSARYVWLRSAYRGTSFYPWNVNSNGLVSNYYARTALALAPACVIC